jgi:hypothetical protein
MADWLLLVGLSVSSLHMHSNSALRMFSPQAQATQKGQNRNGALYRTLQRQTQRSHGRNALSVTDPIITLQMAKYQQTLYVSGALCGFSEAVEPGMDSRLSAQHCSQGRRQDLFKFEVSLIVGSVENGTFPILFFKMYS